MATKFKPCTQRPSVGILPPKWGNQTLTLEQVEQATTVIAQTFACSAELAATIAAKARFAFQPPRGVIIDSAKPNTNLFLLVAGHAQAYALSIDARLVLVEDFYAGALFGESGLVSVAGPQQEVVAVERSFTGQFENAAFVGLMENYSGIAMAVTRLFAERLISSTQRMISVTTLSAPGRIYAELHRQAKLSEGWTLNPAPVLADLARHVQSTRETASRAISVLEKRGIIQRGANSLTVVAPHRLEELIY